MEHLHGRACYLSLSKAFKAIELRECQEGAGCWEGFVAISPTENIPMHKPFRSATGGLPVSDRRETRVGGSIDRNRTRLAMCAPPPLCAGSCGADNALICGDFHKPVPSGCTFIRAWLTAAQTVYWECSEQERWEVWHSDNEAICP